LAIVPLELTIWQVANTCFFVIFGNFCYILVQSISRDQYVSLIVPWGFKIFSSQYVL
jgi:hypothetical protein